MTRTQSLNLDAIDCLEVRTVPKEESVLFAEPEVVKSVPFAEPEVGKEVAPNEGHRQSALTGPMRDAHFVAVPSKPDAAAAGQNAVPFQKKRPEESRAGAVVPSESHFETLQREARLPHLARAAGRWDQPRSHLAERSPLRCDFWAWMGFRLDALVLREHRR